MDVLWCLAATTIGHTDGRSLSSYRFARVITMNWHCSCLRLWVSEREVHGNILSFSPGPVEDESLQVIFGSLAATHLQTLRHQSW